mgnify:CR=1 FL=1
MESNANRYTLHVGDCLETLRTLPDNSVHCCVTSPPYWGLRDYGHAGQIGLEQTPDEYVGRLVEVFREVRRVLRDDGTVWLNLGDSYAGGKGQNGNSKARLTAAARGYKQAAGTVLMATRPIDLPIDGLKPKDLVGIPWRVAFALQADGWWLRQDIIWHKPNPMPESVRDRCTKAHEYVFLLTKSARYFYDAAAVAEPSIYPDDNRKARSTVDQKRMPTASIAGVRPGSATYANRNRRSVWTVTTKPYKGAHFATMPPELAETCIRAGCPVGGAVLDPFTGSGTTLAVAVANGRQAVGIELNAEYAGLVHERMATVRLPLIAAGTIAEAAD